MTRKPVLRAKNTRRNAIEPGNIILRLSFVTIENDALHLVGLRRSLAGFTAFNQALFKFQNPIVANRHPGKVLRFHFISGFDQK